MSFVERSGRTRGGSATGATTPPTAQSPDSPPAKPPRLRPRKSTPTAAAATSSTPTPATLSLADWSVTWFDALDVAPATLAQYRSLTRTHILPRWGATAINEISGIAVNAWAKKLRARYAAATVTTIVKILSMMLADAADERLIPANPIRPLRRGRRHHQPVTEAVWATPDQAVAVALNAARLTTPDVGLLMITAAWTGARWGELTGLHRANTHLTPTAPARSPSTPVGALHEVDGQLFLGPPKTAESARTIALPPFLAVLLRQHLDSHRHRHVFVTADGAFLRRSNFSRRAMRPAADGTTHRPRPAIAVARSRPG